MKIEKLSLTEFNIDNNSKKQGGEALVSKALHPRLGEVAIKEWINNVQNKNEMKLLKKNCNHPNIIQFIGILINDQSENIGYVMPYMQNGSLADVIHKKAEKYDQKQESSWINQICCGLSYLHDKKIIHRDIKPSNVLLGKSYDDVKLSDFGVAKSFKSNSHSLTTGVGTPLYMAPEVFESNRYNFSADIYSLSITIWEILHRRYPYDHISNKLRLFTEISTGERPQLNNNLPMEMSELLRVCWHADPSKRPTIHHILQFYNNPDSIVLVKKAILLLGGEDGMNNDSLLMLEDKRKKRKVWNKRKKWKKLNIKLPYAVHSHGAQFLNNDLYIFGGKNASNKPINWTYKLSKSLQWEKMADMNKKRRLISNSSVILNNKIWVCGGQNESGDDLKSVEMYDPEINKWKYMKEMNESRRSAAAAVINGQIFCCGGLMSKSVECYDPFSDVWTLICNMPQEIRAHGAIQINGHFTIIGGYDGEKLLKNVWTLDTTDKDAVWIEKPSISIPCGCFGIAKIADKILLCGGYNTKNTLKISDGEAWRKGPKLPTDRVWAPAVVIPMEFVRDFEQFTSSPMQVRDIKAKSSRCSIQ